MISTCFFHRRALAQKAMHVTTHLSAQPSTDEVHLMDMATGTADFALEAGGPAFQPARTGVDISPGMRLLAAKSRTQRLDDGVQLIEGDSADLLSRTELLTRTPLHSSPDS